MNKAEVRLIAFDLDGTVYDRDKNVMPRTRAALLAAQALGIVLMPATGRALANLQGCLTALPGLRYALTANGAAVWALGADPVAAACSRWGENQGTPAGLLPPGAACAALEPLPLAKALAVCESLRPFLPGNLKVFVEGRSVCEPPCYAWEQSHGSAGFRPGPGLSTVVPCLADFLQAHGGEIEKICMFFRDIPTLDAARVVLDRIPDITVVQGAPDNLEVTAPGVDKGTGLLRACAALDIPRENTLALGDSENDWGMLRDAGIAVAMANGTPETRARAAYVTRADNNHDGVAEALLHFIPALRPMLENV